MSLRYDVIVVGAGPAGSAAALTAARAGKRTLLVERGEQPGVKNVSGAAFYGPRVLEELVPGFQASAPIERVLTRRVIAFTSEDRSVGIDFKSARLAEPPHNAYALLRPHFDRWLAGQAVAAGAELLTETVVDDLVRDGGGVVRGVRTRRPDGDIEAPVVIACDGVNSFLAQKAGLRGELPPDQVSLGVKEVLALDRGRLEERFQLGDRDGVTYEFIGSITSGVAGGAFLYTNRESLSLGVIVQIASLTEQRVRAYELLERFKAHPTVAPLVRGTELVEYSAHMVPEAGLAMLPRLAGRGILVAGDAAGLCFATGLYLEGINYAIASGRAAAEAAIDAAAYDGADLLPGYRRQLDRAGVLSDFRRYRRAPHFVLSRRMYRVYPAVLTGIAEGVFAPRGGRKRKLLKIARDELKRSGVPLTHAARDLLEGGRAFGW